MNPSPALLSMLNSLDLEYFMCGTTLLTDKTRVLCLASVQSQPFTLVTQITEGPLLIRIYDATYRIEPGQALIVPAHVKYTLKLLNTEAITHWLNLDYTLFEHFSIFDFIETPVTTPVWIGNEIGRIQAEILELTKPGSSDPGTALIAGSKIKQRLFSVLEMILSISRYKPGSIEHLHTIKKYNPVFDYIEDHLAEKIKVSHLAKLMYVSTSHFHKEFQNAFDCSPMQYIQAQRLKRAQLLLTTSTATVREIAGLVGYDNAFAFIRFFKSMTGQSPGNYRKTIWGGPNAQPAGRQNGQAE